MQISWRPAKVAQDILALELLPNRRIPCSGTATKLRDFLCVQVHPTVLLVGAQCQEVCCNLFFFPRVRTPCGHGAQVIVEGREEQTDGGERNEGPKTNPNQTPKPAGRNSTIL